MSPAQSGVYIVEDDADFCLTIRSLLESRNHQVSIARSSEEFLRDFEPLHPSCLLLNHHLADSNDESFFLELRQRAIDLPIIVLTARPDPELVIRLTCQGALCVLPKPLEPSVLLPAIERALRADREAQELRRRISAARQRLAALTPRERQLFELLVEGKSYKEMAASLGISTRTVEHHRARISIKLGTDRVTDMVRLDLCAGDRRQCSGLSECRCSF